MKIMLEVLKILFNGAYKGFRAAARFDAQMRELLEPRREKRIKPMSPYHFCIPDGRYKKEAT